MDTFDELERQLQKESLVQTLIEKARDLTFNEQIKLGDRIIKLVEENDVKYLSLIIPYNRNDDMISQKRGYTLYLFPSRIYRESLETLNEILKRPCNCLNPDESHKYCSVNLETHLSTFDAWFLQAATDHIISSPQRIMELAENMDCAYKFLSDEERNIEIIDWVDTGESMGWTDAPERRKFL